MNIKATMSWDIKPNTLRTKMLSPFSLLSCDLVYSVVAISRWTEVCVQNNKDRVPNTKNETKIILFNSTLVGVLLFNVCMSTDESVIIQKLLHVKGNYSSIGVIH